MVHHHANSPGYSLPISWEEFHHKSDMLGDINPTDTTIYTFHVTEVKENDIATRLHGILHI